jgi:hypothetical protein
MKRFFSTTPGRRRCPKTGLAAGLLLFLPLLAWGQQLGPADIDIFVQGYGQLRPILEKGQNNKEDPPWVRYNELLASVSKAGEDFVRKSTGSLEDLRRRYQEMMYYAAPRELAEGLRGMGWEKGGHEKFITITLCWAFVYTANSMKSDKVSTVFFKLFLERYYERTLNVLEIFDKQDLALINARLEDISGVMIIEKKDGT